MALNYIQYGPRYQYPWTPPSSPPVGVNRFNVSPTVGAFPPSEIDNVIAQINGNISAGVGKTVINEGLQKIINWSNSTLIHRNNSDIEDYAKLKFEDLSDVIIELNKIIFGNKPGTFLSLLNLNSDYGNMRGMIESKGAAGQCEKAGVEKIVDLRGRTIPDKFTSLVGAESIPATCWLCGCPIKSDDYECEHIIPALRAVMLSGMETTNNIFKDQIEPALGNTKWHKQEYKRLTKNNYLWAHSSCNGTIKGSTVFITWDPHNKQFRPDDVKIAAFYAKMLSNTGKKTTKGFSYFRNCYGVIDGLDYGDDFTETKKQQGIYGVVTHEITKQCHHLNRDFKVIYDVLSERYTADGKEYNANDAANIKDLTYVYIALQSISKIKLYYTKKAMGALRDPAEIQKRKDDIKKANDAQKQVLRNQLEEVLVPLLEMKNLLIENITSVRKYYNDEYEQFLEMTQKEPHLYKELLKNPPREFYLSLIKVYLNTCYLPAVTFENNKFYEKTLIDSIMIPIGNVIDALSKEVGYVITDIYHLIQALVYYKLYRFLLDMSSDHYDPNGSHTLSDFQQNYYNSMKSTLSQDDFSTFSQDFLEILKSFNPAINILRPNFNSNIVPVDPEDHLLPHKPHEVARNIINALYDNDLTPKIVLYLNNIDRPAKDADDNTLLLFAENMVNTAKDADDKKVFSEAQIPNIVIILKTLLRYDPNLPQLPREYFSNPDPKIVIEWAIGNIKNFSEIVKEQTEKNILENETLKKETAGFYNESSTGGWPLFNSSNIDEVRLQLRSVTLGQSSTLKIGGRIQRSTNTIPFIRKTLVESFYVTIENVEEIDSTSEIQDKLNIDEGLFFNEVCVFIGHYIQKVLNKKSIQQQQQPTATATSLPQNIELMKSQLIDLQGRKPLDIIEQYYTKPAIEEVEHTLILIQELMGFDIKSCFQGIATFLTEKMAIDILTSLNYKNINPDEIFNYTYDEYNELLRQQIRRQKQNLLRASRGERAEWLNQLKASTSAAAKAAAVAAQAGIKKKTAARNNNNNNKKIPLGPQKMA